MLPNLKKDADGGITLYVQHDSPGAESEANRLPAPAGPFFVAMRLYWPKTEVLDGSWKAPPLDRVQVLMNAYLRLCILPALRPHPLPRFLARRRSVCVLIILRTPLWVCFAPESVCTTISV